MRMNREDAGSVVVARMDFRVGGRGQEKWKTGNMAVVRHCWWKS